MKKITGLCILVGIMTISVWTSRQYRTKTVIETKLDIQDNLETAQYTEIGRVYLGYDNKNSLSNRIIKEAEDLGLGLAVNGELSNLYLEIGNNTEVIYCKDQQEFVSNNLDQIKSLAETSIKESMEVLEMSFDYYAVAEFKYINNNNGNIVIEKYRVYFDGYYVEYTENGEQLSRNLYIMNYGDYLKLNGVKNLGKTKNIWDNTNMQSVTNSHRWMYGEWSVESEIGDASKSNALIVNDIKENYKISDPEVFIYSTNEDNISWNGIMLCDVYKNINLEKYIEFVECNEEFESYNIVSYYKESDEEYRLLLMTEENCPIIAEVLWDNSLGVMEYTKLH